MNTITTTQLTAGLNVIKAIADSIRALGSVPSGHLYVHVCNTLSAEDFKHILRILTGANLIKIDDSGLITWIEPTNN